MYLGKEFYLTRGVWYGDFRFNIRIFTCMEDVGMSYPFLNGAVSESEWGEGGGVAVGISPPIVEVLKNGMSNLFLFLIPRLYTPGVHCARLSVTHTSSRDY